MRLPFQRIVVFHALLQFMFVRLELIQPRQEEDGNRENHWDQPDVHELLTSIADAAEDPLVEGPHPY